MFIDLVCHIQTISDVGCNFPPYPFENQAETEGFGRMANRMGYEVTGLPNYVSSISFSTHSRLSGMWIQRRRDTISTEWSAAFVITGGVLKTALYTIDRPSGEGVYSTDIHNRREIKCWQFNPI